MPRQPKRIGGVIGELLKGFLMSASKRILSWTAYCGAVSYLALSVDSASEVYAQTPLPPVTVDEPDRPTRAQQTSSTQHRENKTERLGASPPRFRNLLHPSRI